jgi:CRP/FNR family nitrogen fixation transcriptional regulator
MSANKVAPKTSQVTQHILQTFPAVSSTAAFRFPTWTELLAAVPRTYPGNVEIFGDGEPADYLYKVANGAVRTSKVLIDGRRQVTGFYLSGDFFGVEAGETHTVSAEAITNSKILIIKRSVLNVLAEHDPEIARRLWALTACELKRAQTHATLLILNANERVAGFLLEMASRGPNATKIDLPMSRRDIADYLGLTIETVARVLGNLEEADAIERSTARHMMLRNRAKLTHIT